MIECAFCGTINEATVSNRPDVIEHLYFGRIPVVVPVWQCNVCDNEWTDHEGEAIRQVAVDRQAIVLGSQQ